MLACPPTQEAKPLVNLNEAAAKRPVLWHPDSPLGPKLGRPRAGGSELAEQWTAAAASSHKATQEPPAIASGPRQGGWGWRSPTTGAGSRLLCVQQARPSWSRMPAQASSEGRPPRTAPQNPAWEMQEPSDQHGVVLVQAIKLVRQEARPHDPKLSLGEQGRPEGRQGNGQRGSVGATPCADSLFPRYSVVPRAEQRPGRQRQRAPSAEPCSPSPRCSCARPTC